MTDLEKRLPLDPALVRRLLDLDPDAGTLTWRVRPLEMFSSKRIWASWNARYAGKEAFTVVTARGYRQGSIRDVHYQAHRVAYAHFYGVNPSGEIDHIDGDGLNNAISNLRVVSHAQNMKNVKRHKGRGAPKGAYWREDMKKWEAKIRADGMLHRLGYHATADDAHAAYCVASKKFHGDYGRTA